MRLMISVLGLGLMALPALAFQETTVGSGQGETPAAAAIPMPAAPPPGYDLSTKPDVNKGLQIQVPGVSFGSRPGTEIKIPGLGTVGTVPRFDFGLELLYGAAEPKAVAPESKPEAGDVQIRGTLKHRF
jgi:hypothetical protein